MWQLLLEELPVFSATSSVRLFGRGREARQANLRHEMIFKRTELDLDLDFYLDIYRYLKNIY